jgi:hypothetical protein
MAVILLARDEAHLPVEVRPERLVMRVTSFAKLRE